MMPVSMVGSRRRAGRARPGVVHRGRGDRSSPAVAVITGAAGVGKSLLVAAAVEGLQPRPAVILSGAARVHGPAPYDWLAAVLSGRDTGALDLPPDALAWLAQQPTAPRERYAPGTLLRLAVRTVRLLVGAGPGGAGGGGPARPRPGEHQPGRRVGHRAGAAGAADGGQSAAGRIGRTGAHPARAGPAVRGTRRGAPAPRPARQSPRSPKSSPRCTAVPRRPGVRRRPTSHRRQPVRVDRVAGRTRRYGNRRRWSGSRCPSTCAFRRPGPPPAAAELTGRAELTAREAEVLGCLVDGMSNKQVGAGAGHLGPDGHRARVEPAPQDRFGVAHRGGALGGAAPGAPRRPGTRLAAAVVTRCPLAGSSRGRDGVGAWRGAAGADDREYGVGRPAEWGVDRDRQRGGTVGDRLQPVLAGVVTALVGFASSFTVVLAGLRAVGAVGRAGRLGAARGLRGVPGSPRSGWACGTGCRCASPGPRRARRCWSPPAPVPGGWPAAVGAFLVCGAADRRRRALPRARPGGGRDPRPGRRRDARRGPAAALHRPGTRAGRGARGWPRRWCVTWLLLHRFARRWAVPGALVVAVVAIALTTPGRPGCARPRGRSVALTAPAWNVPALVGLALPLFLVTMAAQNVPGMAVLVGYGYRPPFGAALRVTGLASAARRPGRRARGQPRRDHRRAGRRPGRPPRPGAPLDRLGHRRGRAGPARAGRRRGHRPGAALPAGAHRGGRRAGAAGRAGRRARRGGRPTRTAREAAVVTFVVTASGVSLLGVGGAFWGLVAGWLMLLLFRRRPPPAAGPGSPPRSRPAERGQAVPCRPRPDRQPALARSERIALVGSWNRRRQLRLRTRPISVGARVDQGAPSRVQPHSSGGRSADARDGEAYPAVGHRGDPVGRHVDRAGRGQSVETLR